MHSDLDRDQKTFLQFRVKGSGMIGGKTMSVSKELVQAYKEIDGDILIHMKYISEAMILATSGHPNCVYPSAYADKVANAMQCHN